MIALVDCNNFYASCERIFRPELKEKPIIVLSNQDGAVISRSNASKVLGIKMGVPYYQIKEICEKYDVQIFSSNYALYPSLPMVNLNLLYNSGLWVFKTVLRYHKFLTLYVLLRMLFYKRCEYTIH